MVSLDLVIIASGNGLLPDGTMPVPEPMLTEARPHGIHRKALEALIVSITGMYLDITH